MVLRPWDRVSRTMRLFVSGPLGCTMISFAVPNPPEETHAPRIVLIASFSVGPSFIHPINVTAALPATLAELPILEKLELPQAIFTDGMRIPYKRKEMSHSWRALRVPRTVAKEHVCHWHIATAICGIKP